MSRSRWHRGGAQQFLHGSGPLFQYPDGIWNHGEGFAPNDQNDIDFGGWFNLDDGTGVTTEDVHTTENWRNHTLTLPFHPNYESTLERFRGFLRPSGIPLPMNHPWYGPVGSYVDQGAFELFRPAHPYTGQKIVLSIALFPTIGFPGFSSGGFDWRQVYLGFFSPDGLMRPESANFATNTGDSVTRPAVEQPIATWWTSPYTNLYYPIGGYAVPTVAGRQTELIEQRSLQLVQAIKCMLMEPPGPDSRNPIGQALTQQQIEEDVIVVFSGGSNGGLQSSWAALTRPDLVHGAFCQTINPSVQRLFGEQEYGYAVAALTASSSTGAAFGPSDIRDWCQYAWNRGLEVHDLSVPRRFLLGHTYRPFCFYIGDEDPTSTGTDWIRLVHGSAFTPSGLIQSPMSLWPNTTHTLAWMSAEKACHDTGWVVNPYQSGTPQTLHNTDFVHPLIAHAVQNRANQIAASAVIPNPPFQHLPRAPGEVLRGIDDPQEWFHGREGDPAGLPGTPTSGPLVRDDGFFAATQPGAAGTWLGHKESMLIEHQKVYVGSAEGIVSSFQVEDWQNPGSPLQRVAQSRQLGQQAWGLAVLPDGHLVAATRRRLHKLHSQTLAVLAESPILPWECAKPYRLKVADVLPGHNGPEVVFASVHGGLVFHDLNLQPLHEWPEPGIVDFVVQSGGMVTLLSERGVVANVRFQTNNVPLLHAASRPIPLGPNDPPTQGNMLDMEQVFLNIMGTAFPAIVGLWAGDMDKSAIRVFNPATMDRVAVPTLQNLAAGLPAPIFGLGDLAVCRDNNHAQDVGDHLLLLAGGVVSLYNEVGVRVGVKKLYECHDPANPSGFSNYTFARQSCCLAVGELGGGPTGASNYDEEVVVSTQAGHLIWLHVQEIAAGGTADQRLPSHFAMRMARTGGINTESQPRTNRALSATWPIALKPTGSQLHVLDPNGNYWRVQGSVPPFSPPVLWDGSNVASEQRNWTHTGFPSTVSSALASSGTALFYHLAPWIPVVEKRPWCPIDAAVAVFEVSATGYTTVNWRERPLPSGFLDEFMIFRYGGSVAKSSNDWSAFYWSGGPNVVDAQGNTLYGEWGNMMEGLHTQNGVVDGLWSSTRDSVTTAGSGVRVQHLDLRNITEQFPSVGQQFVHTLRLSTGDVAILGCPGGRVRVLEPGSWRVGASPLHGLGTVHDAPIDFGHGCSALAARVENPGAGELVRIWVGTMYGHLPRPQSLSVGSSLANNEVLAGSVHTFTWQPGVGFSSPQSLSLTPTTGNPRGGFGVTGIHVSDFLSQYAGDEVVVTTLAGDVIILSTTLQELWRTHVHGAVGCYNSIVVADLDQDMKNELYLSGSLGLWRFEEPYVHSMSNMDLASIWRWLLSIATIATLAPAQRTWTVGACPGPGIDFLDLPPAVGAAAPGDTIRLVLGGACTFLGFTAPHIDKPITITVAHPFGVPNAEPGVAPLIGQVTIANIPRGGRVVLSNLILWAQRPNLGHNPIASGISAWDCAGEIVLEDVDYESLGLANSRLRFLRCERVVVHSCRWYPAEEPMLFEGSSALVSTSIVYMRGPSQSPWNLPPYSPGISREGLLVRNSHVTLTDSHVDGAPVLWDPWVGVNGPSPAAIVESGSLTLGPLSLLRGGYDPNFFNPPYPNTFYGLRMPAGGSGVVIQDPLAIITTVEPGTPAPQVRQVPTVYHPWVVQNETYPVSLIGPPGGFALLAAGNSAMTPLPVGFGDLWIEPASLLTVGIVPLAQQTGAATVRLHCSPNLPMGHVFAFQAAMLAPSGTVSLSLPSPFTVAWEPGRIP